MSADSTLRRLLVVHLNTPWHCKQPMDWIVFRARYVCAACGATA